MKRLMKKKMFVVSAAALVLVGSLKLPDAMAYFTTAVTAKGGHPVTMGSETSIKERFANWTKYIVIENTGEAECWVRVKAFAGSQFQLDYSDDNGKWTLGPDDYWYYSDIVPVGGETKELMAKITVPEEYKDSFDVVVIQECTAVLYDESGKPYADWDRIADTTSGIDTGKAGE
ncbi:MAG: hypothetical protein QM793_01635 [Muricomes sp.]